MDVEGIARNLRRLGMEVKLGKVAERPNQKVSRELRMGEFTPVRLLRPVAKQTYFKNGRPKKPIVFKPGEIVYVIFMPNGNITLSMISGIVDTLVEKAQEGVDYEFAYPEK